MVPTWKPRKETTRQEDMLLGRLSRTRRLFAFLRQHRHELFNEAFQEELAGMYRQSGAGQPPLPPALMAMAALLQGYVGSSDAETVELTVVDLRWQMVLGCLGGDSPAFSQGAFQEFRQRLIEHDMDRRLLERTRELANETKAFDGKKLPKTLRAGMDSAPLVGAGRVEDTINLLGHAARDVAKCAASLLGWKFERVAQAAKCQMLVASSTKAWLDRTWSDPAQKAAAIDDLVKEIAKLREWVEKKLPEEAKAPPLDEKLAVVERIISQDLEPDPGGGGAKIREGVAKDRLVSLSDPEMRHGRKSKSRAFNGYKRHIATDLTTNLILAAAITPANRPEAEAAVDLKADIERQKLSIEELHIDRGYVGSSIVRELLDDGAEVFCKAGFPANRHARFTKADFAFDLRDRTVTCPNSETMPYKLGTTVRFPAEKCDVCPKRSDCTAGKKGRGRALSVAVNEPFEEHLRRRQKTPSGRARLRQRSYIEHNLAHLTRRQGLRARYMGRRNNLFDVRRAATVQNLETIHRADG